MNFQNDGLGAGKILRPLTETVKDLAKGWSSKRVYMRLLKDSEERNEPMTSREAMLLTVIHQGQGNLDAVLAMTSSHTSLSDEELDERIAERIDESDVIRPLLRQAQDTNSESLQVLLSRILAGELESPDGTPRSVVDLLGRMSKSDLESFLRVKYCIVHSVGSGYTPLSGLDDSWVPAIFVRGDGLYPHVMTADGRGLEGENAFRLARLGLMDYHPYGWQSNMLGSSAKLYIYGDDVIEVRNNNESSKRLSHGQWRLSDDGVYLLRLCGPRKEFKTLWWKADACVNFWKGEGFEVRKRADVSADMFVKIDGYGNGTSL